MNANMMVDESEWDVDDLPIDQAQPDIPEEFYTHFQNCAVILAQHWLDVFFAGQQWCVGGNIPPAVLHSPVVVDTVLNTTQIKGIDTAYALLREYRHETETKFPEVSNHMMYVLDFIHRCSELRVPACFRGGLLLTVLHFCQGIPLHGR
jgi:hypothetical protein